jgi:indolepyruvate ferredoxin oxidoreductase
MQAEGVKKVVVVTDEPEKYEAIELPEGIDVLHRDELDRVQRELREIEGVSVLVYDQTCASEKRRRRKKIVDGKPGFPDPAKRAFINELVCEGCGDCSVKSNCMSIEPLETEFGRKRQVNQSSCNKDYSCVNGFCPSFVTVEGGRLKKGKGVAAPDLDHRFELPEPNYEELASTYRVLITGVGGTGVVTIGQLIGMAAHLEGRGVSVLDMAGLAQKGGEVSSHVQISRDPEALHATRIATGEANLVIGCDLVVTANREAISKMREGATRVVANTANSPTSDFVRNPDWQFPGSNMEADIRAAAGDACVFVDANRIVVALLGDALYTNPFMLGFAWQKGWLPLTGEALRRAIELNGVSIETNMKAFEWGRRSAHDVEAVMKVAFPAEVIELKRVASSVDEIIARRVEFLTAYQNAAYAERYRTLVERVRSAESRLGGTRLTEAVARYFFKFMAYKDEYEVARLYTDPAFMAKINAQFEGDFELHFHLAPPLFSRRDSQGHLVKRSYGPSTLTLFRVLAKLRGLRGTVFDVFGYTSERREERALIDRYEETMAVVLGKLDATTLDTAVALASVPEEIRGYGHVKEEHLARAQVLEAELLTALRAPVTSISAARAA